MNEAPRDVVIVGGGLAGAATAFALARASTLSIMLIEQEETVARHSSGRNAGLVRRSAGDPELDAWCDEGAAFLAAPPPDFVGTTGFRRTGSWLVARPEEMRRFERKGAAIASRAELARALPSYVEPAGAARLCCADDGVADSAAVVAGFLASARARGVEVVLGVRVGALDVKNGIVRGVTVGGRRIACAFVVDACGAWAGELARTAGGSDHALAPMRRHLLITAPDPRIDRSWPWLWDHVRGFYARPEAGGWMVSACDETSSVAGDCPADAAQARAILTKLAEALPSFAGAAVARLWAGHRTRRADQRFVLGPDSQLRGMHYACGLGGHGLTAAAAVGRAVADGILGRPARRVAAN
ncbi:MAG: FAD-binding oxidoreductase [Planctomycetes bacterium]|nr:FAD-binding oxidoreductase [Planctomycetota bacterium]